MKALSSITHNVTVLPELPTIVETTTVQSKTVSTTTKISSSPTTTTTTTTVLPPTSPMTRRPPTTKRPREWRKKKPSILFEHPSSHFRPNNSSGDLNDFIPMPKSNLPAKEDMFIVTPKYGMYTPVADAGEDDERVGGTNGKIRKPNDAGRTGSTLGKENKVEKNTTDTITFSYLFLRLLRTSRGQQCM